MRPPRHVVLTQPSGRAQQPAAGVSIKRLVTQNVTPVAGAVGNRSGRPAGEGGTGNRHQRRSALTAVAPVGRWLAGLLRYWRDRSRSRTGPTTVSFMATRTTRPSFATPPCAVCRLSRAPCNSAANSGGTSNSWGINATIVRAATKRVAATGGPSPTLPGLYRSPAAWPRCPPQYCVLGLPAPLVAPDDRPSPMLY